jgi:hypothetical protein
MLLVQYIAVIYTHSTAVHNINYATYIMRKTKIIITVNIHHILDTFIVNIIYYNVYYSKYIIFYVIGLYLLLTDTQAYYISQYFLDRSHRVNWVIRSILYTDWLLYQIILFVCHVVLYWSTSCVYIYMKKNLCNWRSFGICSKFAVLDFILYNSMIDCLHARISKCF